MRLLIVEGENHRGTVTAIRSFARAGHEVAVASPVRSHSSRSKVCSRWHRSVAAGNPDPTLTDVVANIVAEGRYEIVFAAGDEELLALAPRRQQLGAAFPHPPEEAIATALDKQMLIHAAKSAGIEMPATGPDRGITSEVIVKPRRHIGRGGEGGRIETRIVRSDHDLERALEELEPAGGAVVQERVSGRLMSLSVVVDDEGRPVAAAQQRAEATWPPSMGVSVRALTVPTDRDLLERVCGLLLSIGWIGLAQLQFIETSVGVPKLIDLNGRFYGSMALAVAAGVDLPRAWLDVFLGRRFEPRLDAALGVRYQWLEGDLRRALVEKRGGTAADVAGCLRIAPSSVHSLWSLNDPIPALRFVPTLARRALRKTLR